MNVEPIRRAIDAPRLTLEEMATRLGVGRATLAKYREGKRAAPPAARLRLAAMLRAHANELQQVAGALEADTG